MRPSPTSKRSAPTIVDPGPGGELFQGCVDKWVPKWQNQQFMRGFSSVFPFDSSGAPIGDHTVTLLDMFFDPTLVPKTATGRPSIRNIGGTGSGDTGDGKYNFNAYIRERGDAEIQSLTDLIDQGELLDRPGAREPQVEPREHGSQPRRSRTRVRSRRASRSRPSCTIASRRWISTRWSIPRATFRPGS